MTDEKLAEEYICNDKCEDDVSRNYAHCKTCTRLDDFLAGLKVGRQQQSGIGWIDTAHIEIRLHDTVENIKKQLDVMLQEILGGNNKEVKE